MQMRRSAINLAALGALALPLWAALALAGTSAPDELQAGKIVYRRACANCHGADGKGDGVAAPLLDPRPRDFTRGIFKFRTTPSGSVPTLDDLARTETHGIPGTAMGQWAELSTSDLRAVLLYVESLSDKFRGAPPTPIAIPAEPPFTAASVKQGAKLYTDLDCAKCHGPEGRGDGPSAAELKDEWGYPIRPADLTQGQRLKRGGTPQDVYLTLYTGLMGTPMPSYAGALESSGQEWDLVHYVVSLSGGKGAVATAK